MVSEFRPNGFRVQLLDHLPSYEFQKCVTRYRGDYQQKTFSCWDQSLSMAFAQLTYRDSLSDIEVCLLSMQGKLYHMGFRGKVARVAIDFAHCFEINHILK